MIVITHEQRELLDALKRSDFMAAADKHGEINVIFNVFACWISNRPFYCDRGRWKLIVESRDHRYATVDMADNFPNYYFNTEAMVSELAAWRAKRIENVQKKYPGPFRCWVLREYVRDEGTWYEAQLHENWTGTGSIIESEDLASVHAQLSELRLINAGRHPVDDPTVRSIWLA